MENNKFIFSEAVNVNPKRNLRKGEIAKFIDMKSVEPFTRKVLDITEKNFNGSGSKFGNGDTIFARITPCLENGKTAYIDNLKDDETAFGSTEFIVFSGKENITDNKFVYYLSRSPQIRDYAIKNMVGTSGRQRVDKSCFDKLEINIPPLEKQKEISLVLSNIDDKIELNNKINKTLEEMAQAIFKSWFVDFEPFKDEEFEESELGMIPKGWKVLELSKSGNIMTGKTPSKNNPEHFGDEYKFITPKDINGDMFIAKSERGLSNEGYEKMKKNMHCKYSISVSCIGSDLGEVYINDNDGFSNQQINTLTLNNYKYYPYVYICLKNMKDEFKNMASGSAVPIINKTIFSKVKIIVPLEKYVEDFYDKVSAIFDKVLININQNEELKEIRDTLLPKLISGEIKL